MIIKKALQLYIAILMLSAANFAIAGEKSIKPVKIAIIGYSKNHFENLIPVIALLEEHLSENNNYIIVDREHIDKLIKEQELSLLSAATSVSQRTEVGKLIGADILVLLTKRVSPKPYCEIVICDTSLGVRLRVSKVAISNDPEKDFHSIANEIEIAMKKTITPLKTICAVPPFISHDLSKNYDHLQGVYTKILESVLLQIQGVVLVEIAEAHAIADEISLTGNNSVKRFLPFYFVGEYRHDTMNPKKRPFIKITLEKGNQIISSRKADELSPEGALGFLRKSIFELLEIAIDEKLSTNDIDAEYQGLSKKAEIHFSIGQYKEAAQLAEASLLLKPRQPKIHLLAMSAYCLCCRTGKKSVTEKLQYYDQALLHLEHFLRQSHFKKINTAVYNSISQAFYDTIYMTNNAGAKTKKAVYAYRKRARAMYIRIIKAKHNAGTLTDALLDMILTRWLFEHDLYGETLQENLHNRLIVVPMLLTQIKCPKQAIRDLTEYGLPDYMKKSKEYSSFLDELSKYDNSAVKTVVDSERLLLSRLNAKEIQPRLKHNHIRTSAEKQIPQKQEQIKVDFIPIALKRTGRNSSTFHFNLWGIMQCGERVDLVWGASTSGLKNVFLMKKKGELRQIFKGGIMHAFGQPTFDGKYAWLPITGQQSIVLTINPTTGLVERFTAKDGLPSFEYAAVAPIGKGRLCLSGVFGSWGSQRAFIAILELTKNGNKRIKIIHEATKQLLPGISPSVQFHDSHISYYPKFMISKQRETDNSWITLLCRALPGCSGLDSSLLINSTTAKVEVAKAGVESHIMYNNIAVYKNAAYWSIREGLRCIQVDSKDNKILRTLPEEGRVMFYNGRLHLLGQQWWVADGVDKKFRPVAGNIPGVEYIRDFSMFFISAHYGLVFKTGNLTETYQVIFHDIK